MRPFAIEILKFLFYTYHFGYRALFKTMFLLDKVIFKIILLNPKIIKGKRIKSAGLPIIRLGRNSRLVLGDDFRMNDGNKNNFIGRDRKCLLNILNNAELIIGRNVAISSTAIVAGNRIVLGKNIRIGGNVVIYDTDFHSIKPGERLSTPDPGIRTAPVTIQDNVFIGAHTTVLKGVTIGENSVIGAGSVVTRDIPANQIWAGNPVQFIRDLNP